MKFILILSLFTILSFAKEEIQIKQSDNKNILEKNISEKERAYQAYKKILDKENKKLEDDGFCSCNNN